MCTVSMVFDYGRQTIPQQHPWTQPMVIEGGKIVTAPTRYEFEALKQEVEALRKLLEAAKQYDDDTGQPDCETAEKMEFLRRIGELVGVDLSDIFEKAERYDDLCD